MLQLCSFSQIFGFLLGLALAKLKSRVPTISDETIKAFGTPGMHPKVLAIDAPKPHPRYYTPWV
jgi:hypothetical protein